MYWLLAVVLLIVLIIIFSVACVFFTVAEQLSKTTKVAKKALRKFWGVFVFPFLMIAISLIHIMFFVFLIVMHTTSGKFDANSVLFDFMTQGIGEGIQYDKYKILILVFYVVMLL